MPYSEPAVSPRTTTPPWSPWALALKPLNNPPRTTAAVRADLESTVASWLDGIDMPPAAAVALLGQVTAMVDDNRVRDKFAHSMPGRSEAACRAAWRSVAIQHIFHLENDMPNLAVFLAPRVAAGGTDPGNPAKGYFTSRELHHIVDVVHWMVSAPDMDWGTVARRVGKSERSCRVAWRELYPALLPTGPTPYAIDDRGMLVSWQTGMNARGSWYGGLWRGGG